MRRSTRAREALRFALRGVGANRTRSALTTLGVLIGVSAVVLLVAVGNGSSRAVAASIDRLGSGTLTVLPSAGVGARRGAAGALGFLARAAGATGRAGAAGAAPGAT